MKSRVLVLIFRLLLKGKVIVENCENRSITFCKFASARIRESRKFYIFRLAPYSFDAEKSWSRTSTQTMRDQTKMLAIKIYFSLKSNLFLSFSGAHLLQSGVFKQSNPVNGEIMQHRGSSSCFIWTFKF